MAWAWLGRARGEKHSSNSCRCYSTACCRTGSRTQRASQQTYEANQIMLFYNRTNYNQLKTWCACVVTRSRLELGVVPSANQAGTTKHLAKQSPQKIASKIPSCSELLLLCALAFDEFARCGAEQPVRVHNSNGVQPFLTLHTDAVLSSTASGLVT
jgi:hypothetical protein